MPYGVAANLALIQALGALDLDAPLWCVTRGALTVAGERSRSPQGGTTWGLGRVAALELGDRWGGLVDLPDDPSSRALARLVEVLGRSGTDGETEVAIRDGKAYGRRLGEITALPGVVDRWTPGPGTVLITGGTGALGQQLARWLAGRGAQHLLLLSRQGGRAPGVEALAAELAPSGCTVTARVCDVGDRAQLRLAYLSLPADRPLRAVFHAAGVLDDGLLDGMTREQLERVLRAKASGARMLDELTRDVQGVADVVFFSSMAGSLGHAGQGNYAAANAYLDSLALARRRDNLPGLSVAWGPWAGAGLAAGLEGRTPDGVAPLDPEVAFGVLGRLLTAAEAGSVTVADVHWPTLVASRPGKVLSELAGAAGVPAPAGPSLPSRLLALPTAEQRRLLLLGLVREEAAAVLGHRGTDRVPADRGFTDLGFDSLAAVQLRNRLNAASGLRLPTTVLFDHPSPAAMARHLLAELAGEATAEEPAEAPDDPPVDRPIDEPDDGDIDALDLRALLELAREGEER